MNCFSEDTVTINYNPIPVVDLGPDQSACEGETIQFDAGTDGTNFTWSIGGTVEQDGMMNTFGVMSESEVIVVVANEFQCTTTDTVNATFIETPEVSLPDDFAFCEGAATWCRRLVRS